MGPLEGAKVVEIASIGPGPWCAMMLSREVETQAAEVIGSASCAGYARHLYAVRRHGHGHGRVGGVLHPSSAPRFSRTPARPPAAPETGPVDARRLLESWCAEEITAAEVARG